MANFNDNADFYALEQTNEQRTLKDLSTYLQFCEPHTNQAKLLQISIGLLIQSIVN
jgi:hypothetical protein